MFWFPSLDAFRTFVAICPPARFRRERHLTKRLDDTRALPILQRAISGFPRKVPGRRDLDSLGDRKAGALRIRGRAAINRALGYGTRSGRPVGHPRLIFRRDQACRTAARGFCGARWPDSLALASEARGEPVKTLRSRPYEDIEKHVRSKPSGSRDTIR